jgi:L-asparaginase
MKIKIFATGGSIDKRYLARESAFVVGRPAIEEILQEANVTVDYELESVLKKDSLEITAEDRRYLVERITADPHRRIIISHGTDTMIETAKALSAGGGKTIVLTGAMQPAACKNSDAPFNVGAAFIAVQVLPAGVYIAMNGRLFDPRRATKNVTLSRFEGPGTGIRD